MSVNCCNPIIKLFVTDRFEDIFYANTKDQELCINVTHVFGNLNHFPLILYPGA